MNYLSSRSLLPLDPHLLFIQPYIEAKKNLSTAYSIQGTIQKAKHLLIGLVLGVPLINTVALLILRANIPKKISPFDDPIIFWPVNRQMPMLLTDSPLNMNLDEITQLFLNHVFNECLRQENDDFKVSINSEDKLIVKYKDCVIQLSEILEHIHWSDLDEKWQQLDREELRNYLKRSLIFETLKDKEGDSPFNSSNPFIELYTSYGFYSWLNPLLRNGLLRTGALHYATTETNEQLLQRNQEVVNRIAKELLFISLALTANLNALPSRYAAKCNVIRMAYVPKDVLENIKHEEIIQDKGFISASAPGGGFAGGGPCDKESYRVKFVIRSQNGKHVDEFSSLQEHEVLFRPFTKFKVLNRTGDETSGFRIELEEVE